MKYFLGVDGGGTKTKFVLINENLDIITEKLTSTLHVMQTGENKFRQLLIDSLNKIILDADINKEDIQHIVLGVPGYGEIKNDEIFIQNEIHNIFNFTNYYICNDSEVGWAGALACKKGINIVAGTGSIGFYNDNNNNNGRIGGWGHILGDEGGAYWIAKKVLELYTKQKDGRLEPSILLEIFEKKLNIQYDFQAVDIIHNEYHEDRTKIAALSCIAFDAAQQGCPYSIKIFEQAAYELFLHVKGIVQSAKFGDDIRVSYSGGVFNAGCYILKPFESYIREYNPSIKLTTPIMEPCYGAALYSYLLYNGLNSNDLIIDKFRLNIILNRQR